MFAVFAVKGAAAADPGSGPTGAPSSLSKTGYGSPTKLRLSWANGDATAYTRIYTSLGGCPLSTPVQDNVVNPGITSFDTLYEINFLGLLEDRSFTVRHFKNGQESGDSNCVSVELS